jgi:hypothetical protein
LVKQPIPKIFFLKYLPNSKKNLVLEKISSRVHHFLSRVPRFKQGGPKFEQGAAPGFSTVGRTLTYKPISYTTSNSSFDDTIS